MSHWGLVIIFWCSYIWWRGGKRVFLGGAHLALISIGGVTCLRLVSLAQRPSKRVWSVHSVEKKSPTKKTKKARAGTWSHSGADQLGSRWSLNHNVLPMTCTHTPLHSLFVRSFFMLSLLQVHIRTHSHSRGCENMSRKRHQQVPSGVFFLCHFHFMSDASVRPH